MGKIKGLAFSLILALFLTVPALGQPVDPRGNPPEVPDPKTQIETQLQDATVDILTETEIVENRAKVVSKDIEILVAQTTDKTIKHLIALSDAPGINESLRAELFIQTMDAFYEMWFFTLRHHGIDYLQKEGKVTEIKGAMRTVTEVIKDIIVAGTFRRERVVITVKENGETVQKVQPRAWTDIKGWTNGTWEPANMRRRERLVRTVAPMVEQYATVQLAKLENDNWEKSEAITKIRAMAEKSLQIRHQRASSWRNALVVYGAVGLIAVLHPQINPMLGLKAEPLYLDYLNFSLWHLAAGVAVVGAKAATYSNKTLNVLRNFNEMVSDPAKRAQKLEEAKGVMARLKAGIRNIPARFSDFVAARKGRMLLNRGNAAGGGGMCGKMILGGA
ncbi:MAG: hypothetical protein ABL958_08530 [Bdellovibrionia bacterium]